jgi:hypothetical protein
MMGLQSAPAQLFYDFCLDDIRYIRPIAPDKLARDSQHNPRPTKSGAVEAQAVPSAAIRLCRPTMFITRVLTTAATPMTRGTMTVTSVSATV